MFGILMEQIALFVIFIVVGVILIKTKVLNAQTNETISRFVMKLALPVMIFSNTVSGVDREILFESLPILGLAALFYVFVFCLGLALKRLFGLKGDKGQVYRALVMYGNVGFMGIPIVTSLFPERGMLYISVFTIIDQTMLWTLGVKLTTPSGQGKFNPKKLVNPSTTAIFLSIVFILAGIPLPGILATALEKIGATATPLAMIYLGAVFACIEIGRYIKVKEFYGIALVKMVVFPIVFYFVSGLFPITQEVHLTLSLLGAMPGMSSIVMMAKASGSEGDYAMGGIFVTTVCSILTIPVVCWILQYALPYFLP